MIQHTIDLSKLTPLQVDAYCALVRALAPADSDGGATSLEVRGRLESMAGTDFSRADRFDATCSDPDAVTMAFAEAPTGVLPAQSAVGIDFSSRRGRVAEPAEEYRDPYDSAPAEEYRDPYDSAEEYRDPYDSAAEVDVHGVPFDAAYCARAAAPFYGSGKESGQWKKKVGVTKSDYDTWYAAARAALAPAATHSEDADSENGASFDMGRAFASAAASSTSVAQAGAALVSALQPQAAPPMQTAGEFMRWVSEATVAGTLTQPQIDDAWARLGLGYADIMPPTPPERVAANVQALVAELV